MDLRSSLQYKNFDTSHSFWGLMVTENRCLLVTVGSVIFRLALPEPTGEAGDTSLTKTDGDADDGKESVELAGCGEPTHDQTTSTAHQSPVPLISNCPNTVLNSSHNSSDKS